MNLNNNNNSIFFTVVKNEAKITFTSDNYDFEIYESDQQPGTNGKAIWYHYFTANTYQDPDLEWISWNRRSKIIDTSNLDKFDSNKNKKIEKQASTESFIRKEWERSTDTLTFGNVKEWEYLLLSVNGILYSGFINKSKDQADKYYCKLEVVNKEENL